MTPATAKSWVRRTGGLAFGPAEGLPGPNSMASLCNAAPKENLVDVCDPTTSIHLFHFDMTPVHVAGQTPLDLMRCPLAPLWHDHFPWEGSTCPALLHRNCGRKQVAVGRYRHVAGSAQEQSVRREHIEGRASRTSSMVDCRPRSLPHLAHRIRGCHWKLGSPASHLLCNEPECPCEAPHTMQMH